GIRDFHVTGVQTCALPILLELDLSGVVVSSIPRRYYPHGSMAAHVLGFVALDDVGYYGIEGFYDEALQGKLEVDRQSRIPFEAKIGRASWRASGEVAGRAE